MKPRSEQCCGTCAAFVRDRESLSNPTTGTCRLGPPNLFFQQAPGPMQGQVMQVPNGVWVPVRSDLWCLKWDDRETNEHFVRPNGGDQPVIPILPDHLKDKLNA